MKLTLKKVSVFSKKITNKKAISLNCLFYFYLKIIPTQLLQVASTKYRELRD